jgi:uncharacterized repeat protein (TIGR03803 family)
MTNLALHRGRGWRIRLGAANCALAFVVVLGQVVVATPSAEAQGDTTFALFYSFEGGTDGATPRAGLVRDAAGNLYGTTISGGAGGLGTVFKLDAVGSETVLHSFSGADGARPEAGLVRDAAGNLYGTTAGGGASDLGTVFKLDTTGSETVLHSFSGADGDSPVAGLVRDAAGNLYGTTAGGGASGLGTVFKLDTSGKGRLLHSFTGGATDGAFPAAGLVPDAAGNLYGTTTQDGAFGQGTVFKLRP